MQDALPADVVSVGVGPWNQEALFSNPFKEGREEALVINADNKLTYLYRTEASDTGWKQDVVAGLTGTFAEVVIAVHPNGEVWAFCAPTPPTGGYGAVQALKLVRSEGPAQCAWKPQADAISPPWAALSLCVSYSPDAGPLIMGKGYYSNLWLTALAAQLPSSGAATEASPWVHAASIGTGTAGGVSDQVVGGGFLPYSAASGSSKVYVFYGLDSTGTLTRYTLTPDGNLTSVVCGSAVKQFCGTWNVPNLPQSFPQGDVGFIYLDGDNGDLVAGYCATSTSGNQPFTTRAAALGFESATSWQDADGKIHVFGVNASGALQVLHQSGWGSSGSGQGDMPVVPLWTQAKPHELLPPGIGGYNLAHPADQVFAFDYESTGHLDHLVCYRPADEDPVAWILKKHPDGSFEKVFDSRSGGFSYPLGTGDRMFAFDYSGTGHLDHLVCYRPGTGRISILKRNKQPHSNSFDPVCAVTTGGIGGFDLSDARDRMFAFVYDDTGQLLDHLVAYRPGTQVVFILKKVSDDNSPHAFQPVYHQPPPGEPGLAPQGIGGYDLRDDRDQMFAFDYSGTSRLDHLVCYRPGTGTVWILEKVSNDDDPHAFRAVYQQGDPGGHGIGGYPMSDNSDRLLAYRYGDTTIPGNKPDHLVAYRPGTGTVWILEKVSNDNDPHAFSPVFQSGDPVGNTGGDGIGGYDLANPVDQLATFDYGGAGRDDHLVCYRPGGGNAWILQSSGDLFLPVYWAPNGPTVVTVGLQANVSGFQLDPYPDYKPSELIKISPAPPAEAYCISTQDVTTSAWATDKVRLAPAADQGPHIVSHYAANVTLLDTSGTPMPEHNVSVSADSLVEVQIGALSYQAGPGRQVAVTTSAMGGLVVSVDARGLSVPVLYLNTDGLPAGTAIDFAAPVNDYLAGTGTLPSQKGTFTATALQQAQCTGADGNKTPLVADWDKVPIDAATTVTHCQAMYGRAAGQPPQLTAMIDGFSEPQPIAGYVIQKWDPSRPGYQVFRTHDEFAAYRAYRDSHPAYGGFWDDFQTWATDVWEGIKSGATAVAEVIVETTVEILAWVGDAVVSLGQMIINAIEQAVQAVEAVFQMIADAVTRVIDWLKSLFAFKDIWDTKKALQAGIAKVLDYGPATVQHVGAQAHGWFEKQEDAITALFEGLKAQYASTRLGDVQNQAPSPKDPSGVPVDQDSLQHDPQANWMLDKVGVQSIRHPELFSFGDFPPTSPLPDAIATLMTKLQDSGIGATLDRAKNDILALIDPDDPNGSQSSSIVALLDLVEQLVLGVLQALDNLVQALIDLTATVLAHAGDLLDYHPPDLGFINTLYRWIQTSGGIKDPEDATVSGLFCLILGFFVTTLHKLVRGVDNAPFPRGEFPAIPAPPGHSAYDPAAIVGDDPVQNAQLAALQMSCGWIGIAGGLSQAVTDILGIWEEGPGKKTGWVCAGVNLVGTIFFTVISNCPPVGGAQWKDGEDHGEFTGVFAVALAYMCAQIASIAANAKYSDQDPNLKNKLENLGTVLVSVLNWIMLGLMADGCIKTGENLYTSLQNTIQFVPGSLSWIRIGPKLPYYKARAIIMAVIDALGGIGPAVMAIVAANNVLQPPVISSDGGSDGAGNWIIEGGQVGMVYSYTGLQASGGDQPWNSPIQQWKWVTVSGASPTPPGLTIDPASGTIGGAPSQAGTYGSPQQPGFNVQCTDSFGPPQYSAPTPLAMNVAATPIGGMTITSPTGNPQQNVYISTVGNPSGTNSPMIVTVTGTTGSALKGAQVLFGFPTSTGSPIATATFDSNGKSSFYVTTDQNGNAAVPPFTTNATQGIYALTATVPGVSFPNAPISFPLQNVASNVSAITPGSTSTPQDAYGPDGRIPGMNFPYEITATVKDAHGKPVQNVIVVFNSPAGENTPGHFVNGGGTSVTTISDANGNVNAGTFTTAGATLFGDFDIAATVPGTNVRAIFKLKTMRRQRPQ